MYTDNAEKMRAYRQAKVTPEQMDALRDIEGLDVLRELYGRRWYLDNRTLTALRNRGLVEGTFFAVTLTLTDAGRELLAEAERQTHDDC